MCYEVCGQAEFPLLVSRVGCIQRSISSSHGEKKIIIVVIGTSTEAVEEIEQHHSMVRLRWADLYSKKKKSMMNSNNRRRLNRDQDGPKMIYH